jgi:hypothetical protein
MLSISQTIGIVGTLLITLFFSRREIKGLSVDIETKVLSNLDEKVHRLEEHLLERPELGRVINNVQSLSPDSIYSFDVLNVFSHACMKGKSSMIMNGLVGYNGCATASD